MRETQSLRRLGRAGIILVLLLLVQPVIASKTFQPVYKPTLEVRRTVSPIKIDGILNDSAWQNASHADNFVERNPGDMVKPEVETEAYITYDDENLYVAFACYDDPSSIRATMCQRDQFSSDDAVCLLLDTYGEATWAYEFFVNPYGIQKDNLWTSVQGEDSGFDLVWRSAAKITETGYQVEMAIPFSSMRFPNKDVQSWKMDFWRNRPRESYNQYSWAAYDRNEQCWPCQWGTVDGIANVEPGNGLEILPTVVANQSGQLTNNGFDNGKIDGELSLGGKYSVSSDVTVEAYYNPDFSQVEADAAQIDVNTTIALFYPERRPFFQEGSDLFRTLFNSFYTRTVNDPLYAAKVTGRKEGFSFGFMSALDENTAYMIPLDESGPLVLAGKSYVNVLRAVKSFGLNSRGGFIISDRRFEGDGFGTVIGLDGDVRLTKNYSIIGQVLNTWTKEPNKPEYTAGLEGLEFDEGNHTAIFDGESFSGDAIITQFRRRARNWNFTVDYNHVHPEYRTETGYDPWVNYHNLSFYTNYNIYFETGLFERISPQFYTDRRWTFQDETRWRNLNFALEGNLRFAQTYFNLFYGTGFQSWSGKDYDNLWDATMDLNSRLGDKIELGFNIGRHMSVARFAEVRGRETTINASLDLKPFDRLIIEPNLNYARMTSAVDGEELYAGYISRTRFRFQANRQLSLRLVVQYNDFREVWDVDPLVTYQLSPFSIFYVGSTIDYTYFDNNSNNLYQDQWKISSRQFFMKLQYLFQT